MVPVTELDARYGDRATATPWSEAEELLSGAELFWLSTVRKDARPHVTPLPAVWQDQGLHFCTGERERKARNLADNPCCALTTGTNTHFSGVDLVLEGEAHQVTDDAALRRLAGAWEAKYGSFWHFDVVDGKFQQPGRGEGALVFRVEPSVAFAFSKGEGNFAQTRYRF